MLLLHDRLDRLRPTSGALTRVLGFVGGFLFALLAAGLLLVLFEVGLGQTVLRKLP